MNSTLAKIWNNKTVQKILPDKLVIQILYNKFCQRKPNLKKPELFTEKLQYLKLNDRKPIYSTMVDKIAVRDVITERIGDSYLIPLLGIWESPADIDFDQLPNQFVLKCNHNSGTGFCMCQDKSTLNIKKVCSELQKGLQEQYYYNCREWPYKDVKPKIIGEKYMGESLINYKFYCFNGEPKFLNLSIVDINNGVKNAIISFYTLDWQEAPFYRKDHKSIPFTIEKPKKLNEMIEISKILAKEIPFVRVDLYEINGHIYFSELTFFPGGGFSQFSPFEWEKKLGDWIKIPQ